MWIIQIPPQFQGGAIQLIRADSATVDKLSNALRQSEPSASISESLESLAKGSGPDFNMFVGMINFLMFAAAKHQTTLHKSVSTEDFVTAISRSVQMMMPQPPHLPENVERFENTLIDFLNSKSGLALAIKAHSVLTQHERNFSNVRIVSDIRPVYGNDILEPLGAVITHILKIEFTEAGVRKEFFVGLDTSELSDLRSALQRAEEKTKSLRQILDRSGIDCIRVKEAPIQ